MTVFRKAVIYFLMVFAAGFVFGTVRVFWLVPNVGDRIAELIETPFMLLVIFLSARFVVVRPSDGHSPSQAFGAGFIALILLLFAEFTVVLGLRGMTLSEYIATRDPLSGSVYVVSLILFALMPWLVIIYRNRPH